NMAFITYTDDDSPAEYTINNFFNDEDVNKWIYIIQTYDGDKIYVYKNGILKGTSGPGITLTTNTSTLYIGSNGGSSYYVDGRMDGVKIFPYALTIGEIKQEYVQSKGQFGQTNAVGEKTTPGASCMDILKRRSS
ncbi:MAG: hypothetical protein COU30_01990, partial [Candidatus Magasanikbacteria bacterium CG10_big_fil_rev_8_21_14_0_10_38_6]